jgi:hypothetical protein
MGFLYLRVRNIHPMKPRVVLFIFTFFTYIGVHAQSVRISDTQGSPHPSAGLDLQFQNKGLLLPRLTTTQRNTIPTPTPGLQIYNTTTQCVETFFPSGWQPVACNCSSFPNPSFTLLGGSTSAPVTFSPSSQGSFTYQWSFQGGSPTSSTQASPSVQFSTPGSYLVQLKVTNALGCSDSSQQTITITSGFTYSAAFSGNVSSSSTQCVTWQNYVASLPASGLSQVSISGSGSGSTPAICNVPSAVQQLANALRTSNTANVSCNGFNWSVGSCGNGFTLSTTGSPCNCDFGYTVRPCINNDNWGAANGNTCNNSPQTLTVTFQ